MVDVNFEYLMKYLDAKFAAIDLRFEGVDQRFEKVYSILDAQSKKLDDMHIELTAHAAELDRHDRWHHQAADKIGLKLKY